MINVVVLVGRLTRDPELRRANTGNSVCNFSIAVDRSYKQPGQPEADFPNVVCFNKTAENLCQYQRKGSLIGVTGRLQTRSYDDQNGQRHYRTEVIADRIDWLESRAAAAAHQGGGYNGGYQDSNYGGGYDGGYGQSYNQGGYGQNSGYGGYGNGGYDGGYNNSYSQNSGYSNNSYGGGGSYGGGYNKPNKPAYNNGPAASSAGTSDYPSSAPEYTNKSSAASTDTDDVLSHSFDDDSDLDISRDDLPF